MWPYSTLFFSATGEKMKEVLLSGIRVKCSVPPERREVKVCQKIPRKDSSLEIQCSSYILLERILSLLSWDIIGFLCGMPIAVHTGNIKRDAIKGDGWEDEEEREAH